MAGSVAEYGINVTHDVMIPMRDGVRLAADIYRPTMDGETAPGRFPTILGRTSYDKANPVMWVSSTAVDTDFTARLVGVYPPSEDYPSGYHLNLTDSIIRARYRSGFEKAELMEPGEIYEVEFSLTPVSNLFKSGHRIRVDISSSNFPRFDVNPNTGEPVGRHTHTLVARNTIHLSRHRPSHVVLPIVTSK